jgi:hypothetical protein
MRGAEIEGKHVGGSPDGAHAEARRETGGPRYL